MYYTAKETAAALETALGVVRRVCALLVATEGALEAVMHRAQVSDGSVGVWMYIYIYIYIYMHIYICMYIYI